MPKQHILIVEDQHPIRTMVRYALEMAEFKVLEAEDAEQAQIVLNKITPDLILLDWMLPKLSGVDFIKRLKQKPKTKDIPIIMLTAKTDEDDKVTGFEAGADDYIVKPFSPRELVARIKAVLRRGPFTAVEKILSARDLQCDTSSQRVTIGGNNIKLGPLEYRLLSFFMMHRDRVYTRDELLNHVWGVSAYVDERTVDVHIRRLRKRLKVDNHDTLIQTIHGSGYRFSENKDDF